MPNPMSNARPLPELIFRDGVIHCPKECEVGVNSAVLRRTILERHPQHRHLVNAWSVNLSLRHYGFKEKRCYVVEHKTKSKVRRLWFGNLRRIS